MRKSITGFTIVELLIVIIVIGILASISIVAYKGVQDAASDAAVQVEVNQFFKQETIASMDADRPSPYDSGDPMVDYLNNNINISIKSYNQGEPYPFVLVGDYNYETRRYEYGIAAVSRSGKVFVATRERGGVARSIEDWADYKEMLQDNVDHYTERLQNVPTWCDAECVADTQDQQTYYQTELARVSEREARGDDYWYVGPGGCGTGTILGSSYTVYLYEASEQRWIRADFNVAC